MVVAQSVRFFVPVSCPSDSPFFVFSFTPSIYSPMMMPGPCLTDSPVIKAKHLQNDPFD